MAVSPDSFLFQLRRAEASGIQMRQLALWFFLHDSVTCSGGFSFVLSRTQAGTLSVASGGSRMVIKGGLNNEDLRLTLKINGDLPLCNSDL